MAIGVKQRGRPPGRVEGHADPSGIGVDAWRPGTVVEDRDAAVGLNDRIVLEGGGRPAPHAERGVFAPELPHDLTRRAVDLVDGGGVPHRYDEVVVAVDDD